MRNYQLLLESHECLKQIGYGHQCLREEKLSFKNNYIEHYFISYEITNFSRFVSHTLGFQEEVGNFA
jgi:hypothetical protein